MATHSSVLAWRIPGMGEPGGLPSLGSQSQTRLKRFSSSSSSSHYAYELPLLFLQTKEIGVIIRKFISEKSEAALASGTWCMLQS